MKETDRQTGRQIQIGSGGGKKKQRESVYRRVRKLKAVSPKDRERK